ncbi:hypothetical protein PSTT_09516 [Puccinia striiformis]|uniref:Uncharacterized protein n=1 Tax=Puccinia striiformis TaxID=27350 RepID=A0A2S4V8G8_9BASI|nr:hypothetical protein PSTT_09516 [Puccinia striiformis]
MVQLLGNSLATGPEQELVRFSRPGKDIAESSGQSDRVRGSTSIEIGTLKTDVGGAAHPSQALEPQTTQSSHDQIIEIHDQEDNTGHQRNQSSQLFKQIPTYHQASYLRPDQFKKSFELEDQGLSLLKMRIWLAVSNV